MRKIVTDKNWYNFIGTDDKAGLEALLKDESIRKMRRSLNPAYRPFKEKLMICEGKMVGDLGKLTEEKAEKSVRSSKVFDKEIAKESVIINNNESTRQKIVINPKRVVMVHFEIPKMSDTMKEIIRGKVANPSEDSRRGTRRGSIMADNKNALNPVPMDVNLQNKLKNDNIQKLNKKNTEMTPSNFSQSDIQEQSKRNSSKGYDLVSKDTSFLTLKKSFTKYGKGKYGG